MFYMELDEQPQAAAPPCQTAVLGQRRGQNSETRMKIVMMMMSLLILAETK
jgi:hypothetical protein